MQAASKSRGGRLVPPAGLLLSLPAAAHTPQQPPHQLYSEGDLKLESGEAIKDLTGHASAGGAADVEFLNYETAAFLDAVTEGGKKLP